MSRDVQEALRATVATRREALPPSAVPWEELRGRRRRARRVRAGGGLAVVAVAGLAAGVLTVGEIPLQRNGMPSTGAATTTQGTVAVPEVVGLPLADATELLAEVGLRPVPRPVELGGGTPGRVLTQDPAAGSSVDAGARIDLRVAAGETAAETPVPVLPSDSYQSAHGDVVLSPDQDAACSPTHVDLDTAQIGGARAGAELTYSAPPCNGDDRPTLETGGRLVVEVPAEDTSARACAQALAADGAATDRIRLSDGRVFCGLADADRTMIYRLQVLTVVGGSTGIEMDAWYVP